MSPDIPDFAACLREAVSDYLGRRERSVRRAADIYEYYEALFADPRLERNDRSTVAAVIAYFVVRQDYWPEEDLGPAGYLDDLYVAAHAFRQLRRTADADVLLDAWHFEGELEDVMDFVHGDARAELGKHARRVLQLAGLA